MKQADIKRLERAYALLGKAFYNIKLVEEHLWQPYSNNERIGDRTELSIVREVAHGVFEEMSNLLYKLSAIKEVNEE